MSTYAICSTTGPNEQTDTLQYVTDADTPREAYETFADELFSGDRSVEAGWTWHVFQIPSGIADDRSAVYAEIETHHPTVITT